MNKGKTELILGFPSNLIPSFAGVELNHNSNQPLEIANNAQVARWMEPVRRHLGFWQLPESLGISIAYFISDHQRTSLGFLPSPTCTFPFCHILYSEAAQMLHVWVWTLSEYVSHVPIWGCLNFSMSMIYGQKLQKITVSKQGM